MPVQKCLGIAKTGWMVLVCTWLKLGNRNDSATSGSLLYYFLLKSRLMEKLYKKLRKLNYYVLNYI